MKPDMGDQCEWLLLIYALPSQPTRSRAYVWRELKKLGAVYLRDGVGVLPRRPPLERRLEEMVSRIAEYDGTADIIVSPTFRRNRDADLRQRFQDERASEYKELYHACTRFLRDVLHDVDANDFGFPDVDNLEGELGRLRRWQEQIAERDYFHAPGSDRVADILEKCERAFEVFVTRASEREDAGARGEAEDVFERLGGPSSTSEPVPDDYPM